MAIGTWQKQGVVVAPLSNDSPGQPNVLYEGNSIILDPGSPATQVFKMWFGTGKGVCYAESPDGLTWTRYSSNPVAASTVQFPRLFKNAGVYYLYSCNGSGPMACYTSTDGVTFTLQNALCLVTSQTWELSGSFIGQLSIVTVDGNGTWWGYYTAIGSLTSGFSGEYVMGLATSTDGIHWTKSLSNPAITQYFPSNFYFSFYNPVSGIYYGWSQIVVPNIPSHGADSVPSDVTRYSATSPGGPWTPLPNGVPTFYRTTAAEGVALTVGQVADPSLIEVAGNLYLYYTETNTGLASNNYQICLATAPSTTFADLVETNEGVFDVPHTSNNGLALDLKTLASDNFTRANANPIGGNWTQLSTSGGFAANELASNLFQASAANTVRGASYWNAITWPADQWASATIHSGVSANCNEGIVLRGSTSGAATCYEISVIGTVGTSTTIRFDKYVAGVFTSLGASASYLVNIGDVLTGSVIGSTLSAYINGNLIMVVTDSAIASGAAGAGVYAPSAVTDASISAWAGGGVLYSIGGNAGVGGATVSYTGTASGSVTADAAGNYVIGSLANGTYTITPSLAGYSFSPVNQSETVNGGIIEGVNFTAAASGGSGSLMLMGCGS